MSLSHNLTYPSKFIDIKYLYIGQIANWHAIKFLPMRRQLILSNTMESNQNN